MTKNSQNLTDWTLNYIRSNSYLDWLDERKFEWVSVVQDFAQRVIDATNIIVFTDSKRLWFKEYLRQTLNSKEQLRPFLPVFFLDEFTAQIEQFSFAEDYDLFIDMLDLSYKKNYIFWYIGNTKENTFNLSRKKDDTFLWVMDEEISNSFFMRSNDELLDIKLVQLAKMLNKTIDAFLFGEIS